MINEIEINNVTFNDTLDLYNADYNNYSTNGFINSNFKDNTVIMVNPDRFSLRKLNLNFIAVQKILIPFIVEGRDKDFVMMPMTKEPQNTLAINTFYYSFLDDSRYDRSQNFYLNLQKECQNIYEKQTDVINNLTAKYKYQSMLCQIQYQADQFKKGQFKYKFQHGGALLWLYTLKLTLNCGYKGESNFFITVLTIIAIFSLLYFYLFNDDMMNYFNESNTQPSYYKGKIQKFTIKNFAKCLWLSTGIFLNPKFPKKHFNFSNYLFLIVSFEWVLGLFLIILYLLYIAVNYPFVKAILGI